MKRLIFLLAIMSASCSAYGFSFSAPFLLPPSPATPASQVAWLIGQGTPTAVTFRVSPSITIPGRHYAIAGEVRDTGGAVGDKVGVYGASLGGHGSNIWGGNFLAQLDAGMPDAIMQGVEIDLNNNRGPGIAQWGLNITNGGRYKSSNGLVISGVQVDPSWGTGILIDKAERGITIDGTSGNAIEIFNLSGKMTFAVDPQGVRVPQLAGDGSQFACIDATGRLYASPNPCR